MASKYKNILIGVFVVVILFVLYSVFFKKTTEPTGLVRESTSTTTSAVDTGFVTLLLQLKSISLDESIFQSNLFQSLEDFTVKLVSQPAGRSNPFAPIGIQEPSSVPANIASVTPSALENNR